MHPRTRAHAHVHVMNRSLAIIIRDSRMIACGLSAYDLDTISLQHHASDLCNLGRVAVGVGRHRRS